MREQPTAFAFEGQRCRECGDPVTLVIVRFGTYPDQSWWTHTDSVQLHDAAPGWTPEQKGNEVEP